VSDLHLVLPATVVDPATPSGGNAYDRHVASGLAALGWRVREHLVPGPWPRRDASALSSLTASLEAIPAGSAVLVDGLVASAADDVVVPACARLEVTVLVHLPLGVSAADGDVLVRERRALHAARRVVVTSGWTRDLLADLYGLEPGTLHVARPGVDPAPLAQGSASGSTLVCVGAVTGVKGQDLLVEALGHLADVPWRATVVGSLDLAPELVHDLRGRLADLRLTERVWFTGPLVPAELDQLYAGADLLVLPSRVETYGMVLTEALARGIPVVASDVGGVAEALGDVDGRVPGLLVPADDAPALAAALRRWLSEPSLRATLRLTAAARRGLLAGWDATAREVAAALTRELRLEGVRLPLREG
jgi:glycosyltransferase involved in cell wall biosynthesis